MKPQDPATRVVRSASVAGALILMLGVSSARAQDEPKPKPKTLRVFVDTKTLALNLEAGTGRVPLELSAETLTALNTSSEGLTPITENGVTRVDLKGRFRPVWVAVTDPDGKMLAFCLTGLPAPVQAAAKTLLENKETDR